MSDFFTQLKDNLNNRPESSASKSDWLMMQKKLNSKPEKARILPFWFWLAIPFVTLIGTNIWSFQKWNSLLHANEKVSIPTDTIFVQQNFYSSDTVYFTKVIYQTKYISSNTPNKNLPENFSKNDFSIPPEWHNSLADSRKDENQIFNDVYFKTRNNPNNIFSKNLLNDKKENSIHAYKLLTEVEKIPSLSSPLPPSETIQLQSPPNSIYSKSVSDKKDFRKKVNELSQHLRPKSLQLGVLGGGEFPFQTGLKRLGGYTFGLQAKINFSKHLGMWLNGNYSELKYEAKRMDKSIGIPIEVSPNAEFIFQTAKVNSPSFQFSVGMQYLFNTNKKMKPFFGLGYGTVSLLPYEVIYEFEKVNNTTEPKFILDREIKLNNILAGFLLIRVGTEYKISNRLNFNLMGTYQRNTKPYGFSTPNKVNLQGGILYKF